MKFQHVRTEQRLRPRLRLSSGGIAGRTLVVAAALAVQACAPTVTNFIPQQSVVVEAIRARGGTQQIKLKSAYEFPDPSTFGTKGAAWEGTMYVEPRYPEVGGMLGHLFGHLYGGPGTTCVDTEEIPTRWQAEFLAHNHINEPARFHAKRCEPWGHPPDDVAGFATDWAKALLGLQLVIDRDAKKQFSKGLREEYFVCGIQLMGCHDAVISAYANSSIPQVRNLVGTLRSVVQEAAAASEENRKLFAVTDWTKFPKGAEHWQTAKRDLRSQSERLATATRQELVPLLRVDHADSYEDAVLTISSSERTRIVDLRRRACEPSILDEFGIDSSRPMSAEACRLLTWLGNATRLRP